MSIDKNRYIVAIDGPAGSGKSSTAKALAKKLNIAYLDTGAMYRTVTLLALRNKIKLNETEKLKELTKSIDFNFKYVDNKQILIVNNEDITLEIRDKEVSDNVSDYCQIPIVRELLVEKQREYGKKNSAILDGRDIGTVVFPNADFKFFIIASAEIRAKRRVKELQALGLEPNYDEILNNIIQRDHKDSTREISPLKKAKDAIEIDTSNLDFNQQVDILYNHIIKEISK